MILGFCLFFRGGCWRENYLSAYLDHMCCGPGACIFRSEVYLPGGYNFGDYEEESDDGNRW